jgi:AcrR family transcriptional regulator
MKGSEEGTDTRSRMLAATRRLLLEGGVAGFSMRKLAAAVGVTATAIYRHFPDRDALLMELLTTDFTRLRRTFDRLESVADPVDRLRRTLRAFAEFALRNPDHYRIMTLMPVPAYPPTDGPLKRDDPNVNAFAFIRGVVADCVAARRLAPVYDDVDLLTQTILGSVHGTLAIHLIRGDDPFIPWRPVRRRVGLAVNCLLRGLGAEVRDDDAADAPAEAPAPPGAPAGDPSGDPSAPGRRTGSGKTGSGKTGAGKPASGARNRRRA